MSIFEIIGVMTVALVSLYIVNLLVVEIIDSAVEHKVNSKEVIKRGRKLYAVEVKQDEFIVQNDIEINVSRKKVWMASGSDGTLTAVGFGNSRESAITNMKSQFVNRIVKCDYEKMYKKEVDNL